MIAVEKVVGCTHRSQKERPIIPQGSPIQKHQFGSGGRGSRGKVVCTGRNSKAEQAGFLLASMNHFSGLWATGAIPGRLVSGPGVIRAGEWQPWVQEPDIGGGWGCGPL